MIEEMRYKLRMFGIPIDGSTNINCDNEAVYKKSIYTRISIKGEIDQWFFVVFVLSEGLPTRSFCPVSYKSYISGR